VWIDCEMTGLSLTDDALIEVAALVTDSELNVLPVAVAASMGPGEHSLPGPDAYVPGRPALPGQRSAP
ncbi:exonuclease domain-containing protein, partial [Streptomyces anulatus]|uniref:exonuclease domain-containing protein n=1 Tax=Streptomyces anulatus TaxID=1892 RepID=UPI0033C369CF